MKKILTKLTALVLAVSSFTAFPLITVKAVADTCTWTGSGADSNVSTPENWTGCDNSTTPENGDSLVFPEVTNNTVTFDTPITIAGIAISGDGYSFEGTEILTLTGNVSSSLTAANSTFYTSIAVGSNITFDSGSGGINFDGDINLNTYTLTISGEHMNFIGVISSGVGGGISSSVTYLGLIGNNTFTGPFIATGGIVGVGHVNALGSASTGTTIEDGASMYIYTQMTTTDITISEPLTLNGGAYSIGPSSTYPKIDVDSDNTKTGESGPYYIFSGNLTLGSDVSIANAEGQGGDLKITSSLSGSGKKITVLDGLDFEVVVASSNNTSGTSNGTYKSALKITTVDTDLNNIDVNTRYNNKLIIKSTGKYGNVTLTGGTLAGNGTVKNITMSSGSVTPGQSPGCLASNNLTYTGGTVEIEINGTTECTEYDQQTVTGTINLGSNVTTLKIVKLNSYNAEIDDEFVIIDNDSNDAITGSFKGLAEGATFTTDGVTYKITYKGGDGNDVVLTVTALPGTPNTGLYLQNYASLAIYGALSVIAGVYLLGGKKWLRVIRKRK